VGFRYTRAPWTQHLLGAGLLGGAFALGQTSGFAAALSELVALGPEPAVFIATVWILHQAIFWAVSLACLYVDRTDRPRFIARYRIQDGDVRRPPTSKVLANLAVNQLLLAPAMLVVVYAALKLRGWTLTAAIPGPLTVAWQLAVMGALSVFFFYVSHRFLHRKWWMAKVHRVHHAFRSTSAWSGEYAHPVEFCVGNFGTLAIGVVVVGPSLFTICLFTVLSMVTFLVHHSGYALPWASWSVHHDWHHFRYSEAFGTFGVLDKWLGTDTEFRTLKDGDYRP
jgi:sterol desaturase/sphingolipid hydroxylase (fatty acid hydroxylase superfamily)